MQIKPADLTRSVSCFGGSVDTDFGDDRHVQTRGSFICNVNVKEVRVNGFMDSRPYAH